MSPRGVVQMAKSRTTPTTHCQICGGAIKLTKTGKIWHHGYQRNYGWVSDSCPGTNHPPFEVSRDQIPGEIARVEVRIADLKAQMADLFSATSASPKGASLAASRKSTVFH